MTDDSFKDILPPPVLLRKPRGERKGIKADQAVMLNKLLEEGLVSPLEIAIRTVNEASMDLETIYETYGIDSKQYVEARKALDSALKTALPYTSRKLEQVEMKVEEDVDMNSIDDRIKQLLAKGQL